MPASHQDKVLVPCPTCGHRQFEPRTAISSYCRSCGGYFRVQEVLKPAPRPVEHTPPQRRVTCFDCGAELDVAATAESTMCKRCSRYLDLQDYHITRGISKNFKTKGTFVIETRGYVFNTESIVGNAVIKGRFLGKLVAEHALTIYSTAEIKGSFTAGSLVIPADNHFRWPEPIKVNSAEIAGELVAHLRSTGTVRLKSTARLFGNVEARHLVVESGAVIVGQARVGLSAC
jgi:cytoskeletal protein CcmA (bactofilin family)